MIKPLLVNDWIALALLGACIVVCVVLIIIDWRAGRFDKDGDSEE